MSDERPARVTDQTLRRIRSEYLEMPGLCLTLKQAQRLWSLDEETCREAIQLLVEARFLCLAVVDARDLPTGSAIAFRRLQTVAVQFDRGAAA
jgi:hypothetical protein